MRERIAIGGAALTAFLLVALTWSVRLTEPGPIRTSASLKLYLDTDIDGMISILEADSAEFDPDRLRWAAEVYKTSRFKAGRYLIDSTSTYREVLRKAFLGQQDPVHLRIPIARMRASLVDRISAQMRFTSSDLDSVLSDSAFLAELDVAPDQVVGRILPDTYQFYWTARPEDVVRRVHHNFLQQVVERYQPRLDSIGWTVDQAVTMASIIEWEVRHVDEMARVSGLYWNRLRRNMPLQADPTVNYAIGERRRLYHSDYRIDHPYNTYRRRGLPPGPLNNPRLIAIEAAIYPESHPYLFMVANSEGYHTFTRTYDEHLRESRKWVRWLNEQVRLRQERNAAAQVSSSSPR